MEKKLTSTIALLFLITSCDSNFELDIGNNKPMSICSTDIYWKSGWDFTYIQEDCEVGEIVTLNITSPIEKSADDFLFEFDRVTRLAGHICNFDKKIIITEVKGSENLQSYDLSCIYNGITRPK